MIPALATIVAYYVVYRCFTTTLIEGGKLAGDKVSRKAIFIVILLASTFVAYTAITQLKGIYSVAIKTSAEIETFAGSTKSTDDSDVIWYTEAPK